MSVADVAQGEVSTAPAGYRGHGAGALTAGLRALLAAASGLLLTCGVGVVLWAVTPSSIGGPQQSLRAAVAAFAGGNAMTLTIGRASLTLPPLMITVIAVALLAGIAGGGDRSAADDRTGEITRTVTAAAVYAAVVTTVGVVLGPAGAVAAEQWWRPFLLALLVVGTAIFLRGQAWRQWVIERMPSWFRAAVRLGAAGAAGMVAAGAVALVLGLVGSFGESTTVQTLAAPGPAAGFGLVLLGVAYLPNAVVAAAGYASGVGFHIGTGTYSPFGSSPVELPAVPLLAAAPDGRDASRAGMVLLLIPVVVALLVGRAATRRLDLRRDRLLAVGGGAAISGLLVALLAVVAGGGVTGGQWAAVGAPPLLFGIVTAVVLGVFGAAIAGAARSVGVVEIEADVAAAADSPVDGQPAAGPLVEPTASAEPDADAQPDADAAESADGDGSREGDSSVADATAGCDNEDGASTTAAGAEDQDGATAVAGAEDQDGATAAAGAEDQDSATTAAVEGGSAPVECLPAGSLPAGSVPAAPEPESPASGQVPRARREEDVLADSAASTDADLIEQLRPRSQPRQVS